MKCYDLNVSRGTPSEADEQIAFVSWLAAIGIRANASANGGKRNLLEAVKFKRMGVSAGFPDIEIPLPRKPYHGLYIELKRVKGGKASKAQLDWIKYLKDHGYYAEIAHGFDEAKEIVLKYLQFGKHDD